MPEDSINLTEKLVSFQTYHPNFPAKRACLDFIKDLVKDDLHVQEFEFNGFPSLLLYTSGNLHFDLLLAGHIDVVSAPPEMFIMTQKDGKLFGRGVYDMKGSVAAMLIALQKYASHQSLVTSRRVGLLLTSDEEIDGQNGVKAVLEKTNLTADFALLPDNGDNWEIMLAERGLIHAKVPTENKEKIIQELSKHFPQRGNENTQWVTTFTVDNLDIRVRFTNPADEQTALQILDKAQIIRRHVGAAVSEENSHVKQLQRIIQAETGLPASFAKETRTNESDAIYFAQNNIPVALVRPPGGGMHKDSEWLDNEALEKFSKILQTFLDEKNSLRR